MSLATRIESLVIRVAQEFNDVRAKAGNLANLSTTDKSSLVAAINELQAAVVSSAVPMRPTTRWWKSSSSCRTAPAVWMPCWRR